MDRKFYESLMGDNELKVEDIVGAIIGGKVTFAELLQSGKVNAVKQKSVKTHFISLLDVLTPEQITSGITGGISTLSDLIKTGEFVFEKRKIVKELLKKKDDEVFAAAHTIKALQDYVLTFPAGNHVSEAQQRITQTQEAEEADKKRRVEREKMQRKIREDINEYTPDEVISKLSSDDLDDLCAELGISVSMLKNFSPPPLTYNLIPQKASDIPAGYTDVFFWGVPSSGKTCALSAIFSTMKKDYLIEAPDSEKKFGATYRDSLTGIFRNEYGYLPGRTGEDRTQYMPFLFYQLGDNRKRRISFFELSGEVFRYFYEEVNDAPMFNEYERENIEKSFQTLKLMLDSNNQKIHFFFIDYNQESKHTTDKYGRTQTNYLEAAATYFRDKNDILKKKTDAVFVVVTKADEIRSADRAGTAKDFLKEHFGSFMGVLQTLCRKHAVDFKVKLFSIGDVYFKQICKINRTYSTNIIEELLDRVKPEKRRITEIFNK